MAIRSHEPTDLRLAVPAAVTWVAAWIAPLVAVRLLAVTSTALILGVVVGRRRLARWVLLAGVLGALTFASMAVRLAQLDAAPLSDWADAGRYVTVSGSLAADPDISTRPGFAGESAQQVRVQLRTYRVTAATDTVSVRAPVLVIGQASGWEDLRLGDKVEVDGALAPADPVDPLAAVLLARSPPTHEAHAPVVLRGAEAMRSGLRDAVAGTSEDVQGLLPALVVGDTSEMPNLLTADLRESGLAHLTAVSGANVAMVVGAALLFARWAGLRAYPLVGVGLLVVCWFVLLARPQPSVLRAAVMGSIALLAVGLAGRAHAARSLLAAVVLLLLVDPWLARSWGFALSVAATAGLVLLARRWSEQLPQSWPRAVREATAVAFAAQVATLPLVMALSGQIALLSVVANVLATPAVPVATVLGALAAAVSPASSEAAAALAWLAQWPTMWVASVARRAASSPLATVPWPDGWLGAILGTALIVLAWLVLRWGRRRGWWRRRVVTGLAGVVVVALAAYLVGPGRWPPAGWVLVACDVGQGDALVVNLGEGAAMVVDAGPDAALVGRCLDRLGVSAVPLLVLTHFHADHVGGVSGIGAGRDVGTVLVSPVREPPDQVAAISDWAAGSRVIEAVPGQVGSWGDATWRVLWPNEPVPDDGSLANNASIVLLVEVSGVSMLLTGDIEPAAQGALLDELEASGHVPDVDVLKVPHHGSPHQDGELLTVVHAEVALVSVGEGNTYGHPAPDVLAGLERAGAAVARTDLDGSVAVVVGDSGLRLVSMP